MPKDYIQTANCHVHGGDQIDTRLLHEHHIVPRGYGGEDTSTNTVWLCGSCHDIIHRMAHWINTKKTGLAKDLAMQYIPRRPAARDRLFELAQTVAKAMTEFSPEIGELDDEDDLVIVQLHIPASLHRKLKTLASNYKHSNSGRKMGLYKYITNVLRNHVRVATYQPTVNTESELYGVKENEEPEKTNMVRGRPQRMVDLT